MAKPNIFIHLHTLDLRIHDSPSLYAAHHPSSNISKRITHFLPVYILDERTIDISELPNAGPVPTPRADTTTNKQDGNPNHLNPEKTRAAPLSRVAKFHRTSHHRLMFLLQAVFGLRDSYRRSGGDLLIGYGRPEVLVPKLVELFSKESTVEGVWAQDEVTTEEALTLHRLSGALNKLDKGAKLHLNDSKTLIPTKHLPFDPKKDTPDVYTAFRKKVEGLGLNLGGGMLVEPLRTALWEQNGSEVSNLRVRIGTEGIDLKPFPKLDSDSLSVSESQGGWIKKDTELDSINGIYPKLAAPLVRNEPIGGWSTSSKGTEIPSFHPNTAIPLSGSEEAGLARLDDYVGHNTPNGWQGGDKAKTYKATRNGLTGEAFSTKFSGYFGLGSLSARESGWRVGELLELVGKDKDVRGNVYWIIFELLWRDFFQYTTLKFSGSKQTPSPCNSSLFDATGFSAQMKNFPAQERPKPDEWVVANWDDEDDPTRRWCEGRTGVPFIDANMRELRETGWMSNRGRQNVASFFTKDLYCDWRIGAEFFEMHLIDYDTCSNWGNWQYQAGVGNDPRASRQFNPIKQAGDYDSDGSYVRLWIPELKDVPAAYLQTPWLLNKELNGYPTRPIVENPQWKKWYTGQAHGGGDGGRARYRGGGGGGGGGRSGGGRGGGGGHRGDGRRGGKGNRGPKGGQRDD